MMERNKFDKELADRFHEMEMKPDDAIWSRIESSLDASPVVITKPRRRLIPIISSVGVAAAILLSFLLLHNESTVIEGVIVQPKADVEVVENRAISSVDTNTALAQLSEGDVDSKNVVRRKSATTNVLAAATRRVAVPIDTNPVADNHPNTNETPVADSKSDFEKKNSEEADTQKSTVRTKSTSTNFSTGGKSYGDIVKKRSDNKMTINVSGSGNITSSSSMMDNSNILSPLRAIGSEVAGLYDIRADNRKWRHNMPVSFSVTVQKMFSRRIGIETGLVYTYLSSSSDGEKILDQDIKQKLHYIGVPLNFVYLFAQSKAFNFYAKVGLTVDKAVSATNRIFFEDKSQLLELDSEGVQFSSQLQVGASYDINKFLSFYVEPSLSYYFKSSQPASYRTENDFGFSFNLGLRFRL